MRYLEDDPKELELLEALELLSPGTDLREGIDYMIKGETGGLIVVDNSEDVLDLIDGGFHIDCDFLPTRLYELAKMDGAIIISSDLKRIIYANVYIRPNLSIPTTETGMRHQAGERLSRQTGKMVLAISKRRGTLTVFLGNRKYVLRELAALIAGANQTLLALDRYIAALNSALNALNFAEFDETVTIVDVVTAIQRTEMARRCEKELNRYQIELGSEGQSLQLHPPELDLGVQEGLLVIRDYYREDRRTEEEAFERIFKLAAKSLSDSGNISEALGYPRDLLSYTEHLIPRGYRVLSRIPRLPMFVIENLVNEYKNFRAILNATVDELPEVEGIGKVRADTIRGELDKMKYQRYIEPDVLIPTPDTTC